MPKTVVAIHGVGSGESAETGRAVAQNLGFGVTHQTAVYADGQALLEFMDEATGDSVIEVYWADVLEPKSTMAGLLRHISYIVTSMLDVAVREIDGKLSPIFGWLYRLALLTITQGAVLFTLATAAAVSIEGNGHRRLILLTVLFAAVFVAIWLWKLGQHFVVLLLCGATMALIVAVLFEAFSKPLDASHPLVALSGTIRMVGFGGVILMLILATVECWVRRWQQSRDTKLAYTALLYLPFIVMNGLTSWIAVLALSYVSGYQRYGLWEAQILPPDSGMNVRWALIEGATTLVIGGLGILALLLPGIGYLIGAGPKDGNRKGLGARNGVSVLLVIAPISLILLLVFAACVMRGMFPDLAGWFKIPDDIKILEIYKDSVLRTLPYLVWLVGPFALVLDVLGDVLFYLQPNKRHPAAIAELCKKRLKAAINFAKRKMDDSPERKVVVLANSQGAKIAADLRGEGKVSFPLVTTGAPVSTLYSRFLGVEKDANQSRENVPWVNCYRDGDVIAGPIERSEVENLLIGRGGHRGYWSDPKMAKIICDLVERPIKATPAGD